MRSIRTPGFLFLVLALAPVASVAAAPPRITLAEDRDGNVRLDLARP